MCGATEGMNTIEDSGINCVLCILCIVSYESLHEMDVLDRLSDLVGYKILTLEREEGVSDTIRPSDKRGSYRPLNRSVSKSPIGVYLG